MENFLGFRFGNIHSSDIHLTVVSSSDRYEKSSLPEIKDYTVENTGGNGYTYFGSTFSTKEFSVTVAFDDVDEKTWRKISQLFGDDKLRDLVFDELPYKTYRAKVKSKPEFKFICFIDKDTKQRVYKGDGTLVFVCYFPFAFGFNKYITRAADYYNTTPPKEIIKNCQNVNGNMGTPWKGGYPTIKQVQQGELFFDTPDGNKTLIDVRGYWDNVPEWAESSQLLISPTLDFDSELIYLPQYSRNNYINMDTGLNNENALIGARLLVYNPGDLPMDFHLQMNFNNQRVQLFEDLRIKNRFQIRRRNVQRLTVPQAVEWTQLKPYITSDETSYKYGDRYVVLKKYDSENKNNLDSIESLSINKFPTGLLKENHPKHLYISEPIPQEQLGRYIKMFYHQSSKSRPDICDYKDGVKLADRYEELYDLCIDDDERNQLYWETLFKLLEPCYVNMGSSSENNLSIYKHNFFPDYIYQPQEYIIRPEIELNYGEEIFDLNHFPQYYTDDYLEIEIDNKSKDKLDLNRTYYLDSEKKMLYNIMEDVSSLEREEKKLILNDYIVKGHWFQIPPGWSLIEIMPVIDRKAWGGKRWLDAEHFNWGYSPNISESITPSSQQVEYIKKVFDLIYQNSLDDYLGYVDEQNQYHMGSCGINLKADPYIRGSVGLTEADFTSDNKWQDKASKFRCWYPEGFNGGLYDSYQHNRTVKAELEFLKIIHQYWIAIKNKEHNLSGNIEDWWWYACNYAWQNFPPVYWAYADLINNIKIDYIPLFY